MSEHLGHTVLRAVGEAYRANPALWTTGAGTFYDSVLKNGNGPDELPPGETACIHTLILHYGWRYGGMHAIEQAVKVLCQHHELPVEATSIHDFNDRMCGDVAAAIAFVEAPLPHKPAQAPEDKKAPARQRRLQVAATFTLALFLGTAIMSMV